ncbi:uncharacterized protein BJ212DRAFT_1402999 [Suillus subaureus]|uniref:Uncharacterized protein n=1 Tax=Suillus subaureus TaxID=48587 RepID=A0A9P7DMS1_9AGAM|nr:uncharacterized protein BJ212DRAFT_1402999 [Suillus subaureus]KAG1798770.1 hypothetical protein BJ212DRAFT_1402999 [Suillus subaureus]
MNLYQAVRDTLRYLKFSLYGRCADGIDIGLTRDDSAAMFGEDIAFGGVFRVDYIFPTFDRIRPTSQTS